MNLQKVAGVAWPSLIVILTGIYAYWASQRELVSSRPRAASQYNVPDPMPGPGVRTIHSRVWEDPLSTAYEHWKNLPPQEHADDLDTIHDSDIRPATEAEAPLRNDPAPLVDRVRETLAGIFSTSRTAGSDKYLAAHARDMKAHFKEVVERSATDTLSLPVLLPGGPYAEDRETRMRIRYAVVTALAEADYRLKYSRRMSYVVARVYLRVLRGWREREIVVPVKLYRNPNAEHQVLVLYINESELGLRPLIATHRILHDIFSEVECRQKLHFALIGPSSSDMLSNMISELSRDELTPAARACALQEACAAPAPTAVSKYDAKHWCVDSYRPLEFRDDYWPLLSEDRKVPIYSPRATAEIESNDKSESFQLHRVVGTDRQLAKALQDQLHARGALPGKIVLITEHDTKYGQRFPRTFDDVLSERASHDASEEEQVTEQDSEESTGDNEKGESPVYVFRILRGIDGGVPGDDSDDGRPAPARPTGGNSSTPNLPDIVERPPQGRSQYDYLRRLRVRIEQLHREEDVRAIGVVGTDVYDKLLVLRALKPHFPNCIFFTTDLDAIYTHPDERRHTRNLLIATHFGLSLNEGLQRKTPPFRDSYQTATFLAASLAVHQQDCACRASHPQWGEVVDHYRGKGPLDDDPEKGRGDSRIAPLVHLVGSERARQLTTFDSDQNPIEAAVHPPGSPEKDGWFFFFAAALSLMAVGAVLALAGRDALGRSVLFNGAGDEFSKEQKSQLRPWRRNLNVAFAILLGMGLLLVVGLFLTALVRPAVASPFGGYSTWLRNILHAATGILAVVVLAFLADRMIFKLGEISHQPSKTSEIVWHCFRPARAAEFAVFALVVIHLGVLLVFGFRWPEAWLSVAAFAVVAVLCVRSRRASGSGLSGNPIREDNLRPTICAAAAVVLLASLAGYFVEPPATGWNPEATSQGPDGRLADGLALAYAFGAVGVLLASLLYCHFWYREVSRAVGENAHPGFLWNSRGADADLDRLWIIGKLSSVSSRLAPWVMVLLLLLALAYHPLLSAKPIALGLLVVITLALVAFVGSALLLRRHFHLDRQRVIAELDDKIAELEEECVTSPPGTGRSGEDQVDTILQAAIHAPPDSASAAASEASSESSSQTTTTQALPQTASAAPGGSAPEEDPRPAQLAVLKLRKKQLEALSDGVFKPWSESPVGWILGGGASLALVDWWIRWVTLGL